MKPGKARVVKCLIENMAQPNFGEDCKEELQERDEIMKSDVRWGTLYAYAEARGTQAQQSFVGAVVLTMCRVDSCTRLCAWLR